MTKPMIEKRQLFCFIILLAPQNKRNGEEKWGANKRRGQKIAKEKEKRHN